MIYDVFFGLNSDATREFETFTRKREAIRFAKQKTKEGFKGVVLDTYNNEEEMKLLDSKFYSTT